MMGYLSVSLQAWITSFVREDEYRIAILLEEDHGRCADESCRGGDTGKNP